MTIVEFLKARIVEDEQQARKHLHALRSHGLGDYGLRVLAECAAKRVIIEQHEPVNYSSLGMASPNACSLCGADRGMHDWEWVQDSFPCPTVRALAAVYKDHTDYKQEWSV